jgi:hypothetical protein
MYNWNSWNSRKKQWLLLLFGGVIVLLGSLFLVNNAIFAESELSQKGVQLTDLPESAQLLKAGLVDVDSISHPLNRNATFGSAKELDREALYAYEKAYSFSALLPIEGVVVANLLYQYPSQVQAEKAAAILSDNLEQVGTQNKLHVLEGKGKRQSLRGQTYTLAGDEKDSIYWFVSVEDNILFLLMTNGLEDAPTAEAFDSVIKNIMD